MKIISKFNVFGQTGFTLLETMIAVSVLSFGFLATNKLQGNVIEGKRLSAQRSAAAIVATSEMEKIRDFADIPAYQTITSSQDTVSSQDTISISTSRDLSLNSSDVDRVDGTYATTAGKSTDYGNTITITSNANHKVVNLNVSWQTPGNESKSIDLVSVISKTDPKLGGEIFTTASATIPTPSFPIDDSGQPDGAVDNGDGTSNYTPDGSNVVLTYDNSSGDVLKIDNVDPVTISGSVTIATGSDEPSSQHSLAGFTLTPRGNISSAYCFYSIDNDIGSYTCYVTAQWQGTMVFGGISGVKVCTNTTQPYQNLGSDLLDQNYTIFKSSRSCSGTTPTLHQTL